MIIPQRGLKKWWRAVAGLLIRLNMFKTLVIIIPNAPSVKLSAWIPTFISSVIEWVSIAWGAQWQITGYVLLLGAWIFPQCNYAMLILPPIQFPWWKEGFPTVWMGIETWMSKCIHLHTGDAHKTWAHPAFSPWAKKKKKMAARKVSMFFQRWGQLQVSPPWTPELDLLCRRWTGSGCTPPLNTRTLLVLDTEQTPAQQTNPYPFLQGDPRWVQRSCVKGGGMTWILIDFSAVCTRVGRWGVESNLLCSPPVETWNKGVLTKTGNAPGRNLFDFSAPL